MKQEQEKQEKHQIDKEDRNQKASFEHSHKHSHSHEHSHTHGNSHTHEHSHTHGNSHTHEHSHGHDHEHSHHGSVCEHCEEKLHGTLLLPKPLVVRLCIGIILFAAGFFLPFARFSEGMGLTNVEFLGLSSGRFLEFFYYLLLYLLIGHDVLFEAIEHIFHGKLFDEEFLMAIATAGAFAIGDFAEGVAVMLFFQIGELLQTLAVGKSRRSISSLMDIRPDFAMVLRDGKEIKVDPSEVLPGEKIIVRPGEKIPLDGTILYGKGSLNMAALTGESLPVEVEEGHRVLSGSINHDGLLTILVENSFKDSTVSKILELVETANEKKTKVEGFITRFSHYYTPLVVFCALLLAFLPPLLFGKELSEWLHRGLVFLVVSCPCALVVSVPLSFFGGIGGAAKHGILVKGSNYLELLSKVDTFVFDKTGTLTKGNFSVVKIVPNHFETTDAKELTQDSLLQIAAGAEHYSTHPIGQCIASKAPDHKIPSLVQEIAGKGIIAELDQISYAIGNEKLMEELSVSLPPINEIGTVVHVATKEQPARYLGYLLIADEVKKDTAEALKKLKRIGIKKTVMLTGDNEKVASDVAKSLCIDEFHANLLPSDKVFLLEKLLEQSNTLAFVGDGINDAPVLARSDLGIAMGGVGSDAAIESADVVLMDDQLSKLPKAIALAKKTMRIVRQNISFALAAKAVILLLGALGIAGMWIAVFGDVGVMLLAVLNACGAMKTSNSSTLD